MFSYNFINFGFFFVCVFSSVQYCYFSNQSFVKISNQIAYLFNNFSHYTMLLLCNQISSTFILSVSPQDCLQLNRQREFLAIFNDSEKKPLKGILFLHYMRFIMTNCMTIHSGCLFYIKRLTIPSVKSNGILQWSRVCIRRTYFIHSFYYYGSKCVYVTRLAPPLLLGAVPLAVSVRLCYVFNTGYIGLQSCIKLNWCYVAKDV